jgi:nicotinamide mononucleotide transporter
VTGGLEVSANAVNALSIFLAARNSVHTWWTGIVGCALFAALFFGSRLYADTLLQAFFIATSVTGWWQWHTRRSGATLPVTRAGRRLVGISIVAAIAVAAVYGYVLWRFTDAYAPFVDSLILALAVIAQLLLMYRKYDSWWFWLVVNTLSVTLFAVRGLWITAALYAAFWVNALVALGRWRRFVTA